MLFIYLFIYYFIHRYFLPALPIVCFRSYNFSSLLPHCLLSFMFSSSLFIFIMTLSIIVFLPSVDEFLLHRFLSFFSFLHFNFPFLFSIFVSFSYLNAILYSMSPLYWTFNFSIAQSSLNIFHRGRARISLSLPSFIFSHK